MEYKIGDIVTIGKHIGKVRKVYDGYYLKNIEANPNTLFFKQFGLNKEDIIKKFSLYKRGDFPFCETIAKLTEVIEYLQGYSNTEDKVVFGKFSIGDIVISLKTVIGCRKKGDIFKVLEKSSAIKLYYRDETCSLYEKEWRKATKEEVEAYKNGIRKIKEIKYRMLKLNPETDYFIVNSQKEYNDLLEKLKKLSYRTRQIDNFVVSKNWKYVTCTNSRWELDCVLSHKHCVYRKVYDLLPCTTSELSDVKVVEKTSLSNKTFNKLKFNHKNKQKNKIKLSTL